MEGHTLATSVHVQHLRSKRDFIFVIGFCTIYQYIQVVHAIFRLVLVVLRLQIEELLGLLRQIAVHDGHDRVVVAEAPRYVTLSQLARYEHLLTLLKL